jgi:TonB family protein
MGSISTQSIFQTSIHKSSWRSYAVSVVVHGALTALAVSIVVPAAIQVHKSFEHVSLLAPLPEYKTKPVVQHVLGPRVVEHAKTFSPPPITPQTLAHPKIVEAPEIREVQPIPEARIALQAVAKSPIQTGVFQSTAELAKAAPAPTISIGGFGDSHGTLPADTIRKDPALLTKVGTFDSPDGAGRNGAGGRAQSGSAVRQTAFGSEVDPGRPKMAANSQGIHTTTFGDATLTPPPPGNKDVLSSGASPVEILFKPKPVYTAEARNLRLEGEVSLRVVFQANGTVRLVRVVRGLGHGLDEAAAEAAMRVRFKPATRGGVAVDTDATINITFELT